jgi:hypothetical protein
MGIFPQRNHRLLITKVSEWSPRVVADFALKCTAL